jgi:hypothetical protein
LTNDSDAANKALEKIIKFNNQHPSVYIPAESITKSIADRLQKSAMTKHGLYLDKRFLGVLDRRGYLE